MHCAKKFVFVEVVEITCEPSANWIWNGISAEIYIKNTCTTPGDTVTITAPSGEKIDGQDSVVLNNYESALLVSDGNNLFLK
jgi:hypothetical protein